MNSNLVRVKHFVKMSRWTYPLRWLWVLLLLPHYIFKPRENSFGVTTREYPFSMIREPDPMLARAEKRNGTPISTLSPEQKKQSFYSYFSETGDENYEKHLTRQYKTYLPLIPSNHSLPFLDIGCGAGEFVQFLKKSGVNACGIDLEASEVERAKARGLNVSQANAVDFLKTTEQKFSGISMIQVIEHLPFERVGDVIENALRCLEKNGILIVETVNMRHPFSLDSFYSDPTHQRPVPEEYVVFLMQWHGFKNMKVVYTNPNKQPGTDPNDIRSIYHTYAVVGRRQD